MALLYLLLPVLTYSEKHLHIIRFKSNDCGGISNAYDYDINECIALSNGQSAYIECNDDIIEIQKYDSNSCNNETLISSNEYQEGKCYNKKTKYECVDDNWKKYRNTLAKILGGMVLMCFVCFCLFSAIGGGVSSYSRSYPVPVLPVPAEPDIRVAVIHIESESNINFNDEGL
jgi:hypothetical protein